MREYIHYGDTEFNKDKFTKVTNEPCWVKPNGGLWASSIDTNYGWKDWCDANDFRECNEDNSFKFTLTETAKVLHIHSVKDLEDIPEQKEKFDGFKFMSTFYIDFEKLIEMGYDAVELHLSDDGYEFGTSLYYKLYGWDCDSIVIMNPDIVVPTCA
jgi:hypothetical protein